MEIDTSIRPQSDKTPKMGLFITLAFVAIFGSILYYTSIYGFSTARAAASGNLATVKRNVGWNPRLLHARPDGWTLLNYAAASGKLNVVKFLVGEGADIDAENEWGLTSLELASQNGYTEVAAFLVKEGAKTESALHQAIREGRHRSILGSSLHEYYVNNIEYESGNTPLMTAAEVGNEDLVRRFLQVDPEPERKNKNGRNAMDLALEGDHEQTVELLRGIIRID